MTKVSGERIKVTLACMTCRKKKLKCDGKQPCSRCKSNRVECQYTNSNKKRGPIKCYGEVIGNRTHRIESLLKQQQKLTTSSSGSGSMNKQCVITYSSDMISDTFTKYFFTHFNSLFPLFPQNEFKKENPLVLSLAMSTLGALYSSSEYHPVLFEKAEKVLKESKVQVFTVQALVIMCWYCHLVGDAKRCDGFRRQLSQAIEWLQLVQDDTDTKSRIYWVSWVMDQWIASCSLSEKMIIQWDSCCPWPLSEERFHELIRLSMILDEPQSGEDKLTEWLLCLPSNLDSTKTSCIMAKLYRLLYYTAQMISNQRHQHPLSNSICITAANTILYITEQIIDLGQTAFLYNIFFISLSFATSFVHLNSHSFASPTLVLKQANCTLLPNDEFDPLIQRYFANETSFELCNVQQILSDELFDFFLDNTSNVDLTYFSPIINTPP
ncbi:hypothetical protein G6F56_008193 [Rhizopus delemar]|nr:hypothetical protein G6F56_008193 [Rhizopus delemar]